MFYREIYREIFNVNMSYVQCKNHDKKNTHIQMEKKIPLKGILSTSIK